jgi:hypothetical protein
MIVPIYQRLREIAPPIPAKAVNAGVGIEAVDDITSETE